MAPRFWVLNCNSTKGGVGEERCIANIDSRTKNTVVISLKVDFFSKLICVVKVDTAQNTIKGVFRYGSIGLQFVARCSALECEEGRVWFLSLADGYK